MLAGKKKKNLGAFINKTFVEAQLRKSQDLQELGFLKAWAS